MSNSTDHQPPHEPPTPPPQHFAPPKKRRRWIHWIAYPIVGLLGLVIGGVGGGGSDTPTASTPGATITVTKSAPAATKTAPSETTAPSAYGKPVKADFKLTPKVLSKQCFGSAGCNVTFRILINYTGPVLEPGKEYEVLYEVRGGEDGPISNKFTVTGDESSVDEEEMVSTKSSRTKLTAVVTDVL